MNATTEILEIRFRFERNWTVAYALYGPVSDGTLGVQGWHAKRFPPNVPMVDIIRTENPMLWPQESP